MVADKIVVTGGSGLLGRSVIDELVETGYDVLNVDTRNGHQEPLNWQPKHNWRDELKRL